MLRNTLAAALRNLARNRLYAAINIIGLAIGLTAAIFAGLYLRDELTYDRWVPDHERVYDIATTRPAFRGTEPLETASTLETVPPLLLATFPEIEFAARLSPVRELKISRGDVVVVDPSFAWADPDFFRVLRIEAIAGDASSALDTPDGAVLTRSLARKIFGTEAPIGARFEVDGRHEMRVTAVIEDWPSNSNLRAMHGFLSGKATFSRFSRSDGRTYGRETELWAMPTAPAYLRFSPQADIEHVRKALPDFVAKHLDQALVGNVKLRLRPLASIHLDSASRPYARASGGPNAVTVVAAVASVGALTLFLAAVNFVNIMTARATKRAVEVGARKTCGASRAHLFLQFVGEALLYAGCGALAACALVTALMPVFNAFLDREILFDPLTSPALGGDFRRWIASGIISRVRPVALLPGDCS